MISCTLLFDSRKQHFQMSQKKEKCKTSENVVRKAVWNHCHLKDLVVEKINCSCVGLKHLVRNMTCYKEVSGSLPDCHWFVLDVVVSSHKLLLYSFVFLSNIGIN